MSATKLLPSPKQVAAEIVAVREELAALRRLHRAAVAAAKAEAARERRRQVPTGTEEAAPCR